MSTLAFTPTPWPTLPIPSEAERRVILGRPGGLEELTEALVQRERLIKLEKADPLRYGWEPECWQDARRLLREGDDLLILGGNRSSKSEFAAKYVNEVIEVEPARNVWCFQANERASIERQQPVVFRYLPQEQRRLGKRGMITYVKYSLATGFSDGRFVKPNSSYCRFMNYSMESTSFEGMELDGAWCDELVPPDLLDTLRFRRTSRGGFILVTFTPIEGYSVTVKQYLEGARVIESRPAPLLDPAKRHHPECPRGHMPYILECAKPGRHVICFFTEQNPHYPPNNYTNLVKQLREAREADIKCRAYGWPERMIRNAFPKFGGVHIIPHDQVPAEGTNYMVLDPGGAKNWFFVWLRVDSLGRVYVYREWPDMAVGPWAEASDKADGRPGKGQRADAGRGILAYRQLVAALEGRGPDSADPDAGERILLRLIDPRAGASPVPGMDTGTSIQEMMASQQEERDGKVTGAPLAFVPAPACRAGADSTDTGLINNLLDYDPEQPVNTLNCPKLYVSDRCQNVIYALRTWTGLDGEKGATKDPIDCLKYAAKQGLLYIPPSETWAVTGGGCY